MLFRAICLIICSILTAQKAFALEVCGDLKQGELIFVKEPEAENLTFFNNLKKRIYKPTENSTFLVALHRDISSKVLLEADYKDKKSRRYNFKVSPVKWDIQRINGVSQHKVTPQKEHQKEILRELNDVNRALSGKIEEDYWQKGFILPIEGHISGNFGNQRVFNGVPKNPHSGTDIAAAEGTPVKAAGDGIVTLSGADYFYTGNMVIIDHGRGLQTIYAHLLRANVREGQKVSQGDVIGLVGKTGRAKGAHLHWGASLNGVRFRPHSLLDINEKICRKID